MIKMGGSDIVRRLDEPRCCSFPPEPSTSRILEVSTKREGIS